MRFASRPARPAFFSLQTVAIVGAAAIVAVGLGFGCGGGGGNTSTATTGTFAAGGAGGKSSGHTGTGGEGGMIFNPVVGSSTTGTMSTGTGMTTTGTGMTTTGSGGAKPVCDMGTPTTGAPQWAENNGNDGAQYAVGVTTDTAGNVFVTGQYPGTFSIGGKSAPDTAGKLAVFVAKLGPDGKAAWVNGYAVNAFSGLHPQPSGGGHAVATDSLGNVYVVGDLSGVIDFGGGNTVQSAGAQFGDIFLLKLDGSGNTLAAKRIGDPAGTPACCDSGSTSRTISILKSSSGDQIAIGGESQGTLDIGGGKTAAAPGGAKAAFLAVLSASNFTPGFVLSFGDGSNDQSTHSIVWDKNKQLLIAGNTTGPITFPGMAALTPAGAQAAFVAKLATDGSSTVWAKIYGSGTAGGEGIATDGTGDIFVTGDHTGDIDFGGGALPNTFGANVFVAKLDTSGNHVWSYTFGDSTAQHAHGITVDSMGHPVVVGEFTGSIDFGGGAMMSAGKSDIFVTKLDTHGCQIWAHSYGDAALQAANAVALDPSGNAIVAGTVAGMFMVGSTTLTVNDTNPNALADAFVAKFAP